MARKEVSKMVFDSMDQFSTWFEEEGHEMNDENVVTIVKDNDWIRIDIDTHCVRPSTAVRRMFAQLKDIPEVEGWEEVMLEHIKTVESDWCWKSNDATMADGTTNKYQTFAYSIEDLDSDHWYVFLNVRTAESMKRIEAEQLAWWEADRADEIETAVAEEVQKEMDEERMEKEMEKKEALLLITRAKNSILTGEAEQVKMDKIRPEGVGTMAKTKKERQEVQDAWKAEHTTLLTLRLNNRTDADILQRLDGVESKQGEVKRLIRLGMEAERNGMEQKER